MSRARPFREQRAKSKSIKSNDVALIVCEGEKTEPNYITEIWQKLRPPSASIRIIGLGADPTAVVSKAIANFDEKPHFDRVYCVFDRDEHTGYQTAVDRCRSIKRKNKTTGKLVQFICVTSWPCFEYWLLLHFNRSNAPINASGGRTAAQVVLANLRKELVDYNKNSKSMLEQTEHLIVQASRDANRFLIESDQNPHTKIYRLIAFLASVSSRNDIAWRSELHALAIECGEVQV